MNSAAGEFAPAVQCLVDPALAALDVRLTAVSGLGTGERDAVLSGARTSWYRTVRLLITRLLLLELHAARLAGQLSADTERGRWEEFLELSGRPAFWSRQAATYPALAPRLRQVLELRTGAVLACAERVAADRTALAALVGREPGELVNVGLDAGDSHRGGHTVARLEFTGGRVMYKPRSLRVDRALAGLLDRLAPAGELAVPRVVLRDGYGYAAQVAHSYVADAAEEGRFYRALGGWLAVMRLVRGADLHAENVVAAGPVPYVVDCETLFCPEPPVPGPSLGGASGLATAMIRRTTLRTGLLPWRRSWLALRGVDNSAVGALPGQQPMIAAPVVGDAGTDRARLVMAEEAPARAANHPTPEPHPERFGDALVDGFRTVAARVERLRAGAGLGPALAEFQGCELRLVARPTQVYVEVGRMLWHPASLADEPAAVRRAADVLTRQAERLPGAPAEPATVAAEVTDLLRADIPVFTFTPDSGLVTGPDGVRLGDHGDQLTAAAGSWDATGLDVEETVIRASLAAAHLNQEPESDAERLPAPPEELGDLEARRRALARHLIDGICAAAILGPDGTATWIGPTLTASGWTVRPFGPDLYSGQAGMVAALAGYVHEAAAGRADPVSAAAATLDGAVATLEALEEAPEAGAGPDRVGGFTGLGGGIWTWLLLHRLRGGRRWLDRARRSAELIPAAIARDRQYDILNGAAGALIVALELAERCGDDGYLLPAELAADQLARHAIHDGRLASWPFGRTNTGVGGFAHGAAGIGWALTRLGLAGGNEKHLELGRAAFAFQESLWRAEHANWQDVREPSRAHYPPTWCNGSAGIGLASWDLSVRTNDPAQLNRARRAGDNIAANGYGWNHTLCHGDLGSWELTAALGTDPTRAAGRILTSMELHGPVSGLRNKAPSPGLMTGLAGMVYQLLRMPDRSRLPSVLLLQG